MATATRHNGIVPRDELQDDMQIFTVNSATILDSLGAYCTEGQEAALTEKEAKHYYKLKLVQAAMPDFTPKTTAKKEVVDAIAPDAKDAKVAPAASADKGQVKP